MTVADDVVMLSGFLSGCQTLGGLASIRNTK